MGAGDTFWRQGVPLKFLSAFHAEIHGKSLLFFNADANANPNANASATGLLNLFLKQ